MSPIFRRTIRVPASPVSSASAAPAATHWGQLRLHQKPGALSVFSEIETGKTSPRVKDVDNDRCAAHAEISGLPSLPKDTVGDNDRGDPGQENRAAAGFAGMDPLACRSGECLRFL